MATSVTVLVELDTTDRWLAATVTALDAQTLPTSRFDVIFAGAAAGATVRQRIEELAQRRPNVRITPGTATDALAEVDADWVLLLGTRDCDGGTLRPAALERLVRQGDESGSDLVLGRVDAGDGRVVDDLLVRDATGVAATADTVLDALVLQRRAFAVEHGLVADLASAASALAAAGSVATVGTYQCLYRSVRQSDGAVEPPEIASVTARWEAGVLVVDVSGAAAPVADAEVVLAVRSVGGKVDHWLPTSGSVHDDGTFSASARFDPSIAADARWAVTVGVHGAGARRSGRCTVRRPAEVADALVGGRPVVVEDRAGVFTLDVGAIKSSIVGTLTADEVTITESVRGTLLSATLPRVVSAGGQRVLGSVRLGSFPLPAYLVGTDDGVRLECYLSGIAGRNALSTHFGRTTSPTGLDLVISGTGIMTVQRHRAAPAATPAKAPASAPAPRPAARPRTVQRLRRAVPAPLEPAVRSMAHNPAFQRLYRKLAGLPGR